MATDVDFIWNSPEGSLMRVARVLIVDDDSLLQQSLSLFLTLRGYEVEGAMTAHDALDAFARRRPDLIVLDLGLPDRDGSDVCLRVRQESAVPIIVLSARGEDQDKIAALEKGADDYISKPFSSEEFLARVRVALRRGFHASGTGRLDRGGLIIDFDRRRVQVGTNEIRLTPKEFELLVFLARHPNRVLPHREILIAMWGQHAGDRPEQLWALVTKVRRKIEPDPEHPRYLLSEPWVGYQLVTDPERDSRPNVSAEPSLTSGANS
jgi:two-component system KDP operon response regulator KdpE